MQEKRPTWGSRIGFIFAAAGSAVGLANIWRFPYILGMHGGAAFFLVYIICLFLVGFPVFITELLIGRTTRQTPASAFLELSGKKSWSWIGKMTIVTGFLVSSFYAAVAGWILGYLFEAFRGNLTQFQTPEAAASHFEGLLSSPWWGLGFFTFFLALSAMILFFGVKNGIEKGNKVMMPALFAVLTLIVIRAVTLPGAKEGIVFLLTPDWSALTPTAIMIALGQSFFTVSLGQGTMVTYGSYLGKKDNLVKSSLPIIAMDTLVSVLAAIAVFSIVFFGGLAPDSGPGLLFHTLPLVFAKLPGGDFIAALFFLLVFLAAITSQISAMEPAIAYLIDTKQWKRKTAVIAVSFAIFLVGIPSALSSSVLSPFTFFNLNFLDLMSFVCSSILIPLGGLAAAILVGWVWGMEKGLNQLKLGAQSTFASISWLETYFWFCVKYLAPVLIGIVFINALSTS
jgi:NSS family neurotransmitter:Na+ symporter